MSPNHLTRLAFAVLAGLVMLGCKPKSRITDKWAHPPQDTTTFVLRLKPANTESGEAAPITRADTLRAMESIDRRLQKMMGEYDLGLSAQDDGSIQLRMASIDEKKIRLMRELIARPGLLQLHQVSQRSDEVGLDGRTLSERVLAGDEILPGYRAYKHGYQNADGQRVERAILLHRRAALTGADVADAHVAPGQADAVAVTLSQDGAEKMIAFTSPMQPGIDRIAIVLDGEVVSAPVVNSVPLGRNFIVEGLRESGEPEQLAAQLMCPLEVPVEVEQIRSAQP
ncbi:MAG TPA: hypothetical protein VFY13_07815 [Luteolibacter sp.]|nr:hypothetical protein [Luteolibacter sp.]